MRTISMTIRLGGHLAAIALVALALLVAPEAGARVKIEQVKAKGGLAAWLVRDTQNPIISMTVLVRNGGSTLDPKGKEGLARFAAALFDEGAGDLKSQDFQRRLEDLSISISFNAGRDHLRITLRTLRKNRAEAFRLLKLAMSAPRFDDEPVARVRSQTFSILARQASNPRYVASRAWWNTVFPDHPYGRPMRGTPASVKSITKADLQGYAKARIARDALVVSVTGDITAAELKGVLENTFGGLPARAAKVRVAKVRPKVKGEVAVIRRPFPQSVVIFGQAGPARRDRDFYATFVMNHILGGGSFSSRLYQEVREKRGLAYSVGSHLAPMRYSALIAGSVSTQNGRVKETVEQIRAQWKRMAAGEVTEAELKQAKLYLTGSYPLRFTNTQRIATMLAWVQMLDLGIDFIDRRNTLIERVTLADIKRAAKNHLDTNTLFFVVVGNPEGLGKKG